MTLDPSSDNSTPLHDIARSYVIDVAPLAMEGNSKLLQTKPMTVAATRLKNVRCLMQDRLGIAPKQKDFAKIVGCTPNSFNQYLTGNRKIGTDVARRIERKCNKDEGWLDMPHPQEWEKLRNYDGYRPSEPNTRNAKEVAARLESLADDELTEHILYMIRLAERQRDVSTATIIPIKRKTD